MGCAQNARKIGSSEKFIDNFSALSSYSNDGDLVGHQVFGIDGV